MRITHGSSGIIAALGAASLLSLGALTGCGGSDDAAGPGAGGAAGSASGGAAGSASGGAAGSASGGAAGSASGGAAGSASGGTGGASGGAKTFSDCFANIYENPRSLVVPNYDKFGGNYNSTCSGTNNQDIQGVERVVFLGDSITVGPGFPTPANLVYRTLLTNRLKQRFPGVAVSSCAVNGAKVDDFFSGDRQISKCFPGVEQKKTLTIFTMGGNDIKSVAGDKLSPAAAQPVIDKMITDLRATIEWLKDPVNFPNGSYVVFANVYEYTDLTGDLSSCPAAGTAGLSGQYLAAAGLITQIREKYMQIASETGTDMIFMGEDFCGRGYHSKDAGGQCYRGPNTPNWFDISCIHPTNDGHAHIADMFFETIAE
ncbi:MAG: SGNH/GDSL hydrolase family protein [Sorangiineae bacterium]|nr:SGNH/GDSL hydrolase family protein [Polyangiaceae bacterium]MEB2321649.1 SGNH/GDSL hydrolase family protein [Sorangiineae bacterium]